MNLSNIRDDAKNSRNSDCLGGSAYSAPSEQMEDEWLGKQKHYDVDVYDPEFYKLPVTERSKILRAKRNREAAHRSRTKNKIRQAMLEEETRKQMQLNKELSTLMNFLLPELTPGSASGSASKSLPVVPCAEDPEN